MPPPAVEATAGRRSGWRRPGLAYAATGGADHWDSRVARLQAWATSAQPGILGNFGRFSTNGAHAGALDV